MRITYANIYAGLLLFGGVRISIGRGVEKRSISYENPNGSYLVTCYVPPFESLEIPGVGPLNIHKGHRLIPVGIPEGSELCDSPLSLFEPENEIWDNNILVPRDFEDFTELMEEAKILEEDKDAHISSKINEILKEAERKNTPTEPPIVPKHAMPLYADKTENKEKSEGGIISREDSSLLDNLSLPSDPDKIDDALYSEEVKNGVSMRIFMFIEFYRDNLARNGLFSSIDINSMYTEGNFNFFGSNWSSFEGEEIVFEDVPYSIWQGFSNSDVLTADNEKVTEETKRKLVLTSLNEFINGLEKYYSYKNDGTIDYKYYLNLKNLGIEEAVMTIKYYRDSTIEEERLDNSLKVSDFEESNRSPSPGSSSISTSSMYVPSDFERSGEISTVRESAVELSNTPNYMTTKDYSTVENSEKSDDVAELSKSQREIKNQEDSARYFESKNGVESRIKWFRIFVNEYLGRIGINFSISEQSCNNENIYELFKYNWNEKSTFPELVWALVIENGFYDKISELLNYDEKRKIVEDMWLKFVHIETKMFGRNVTSEDYNRVDWMMDIEIRDTISGFLDRMRIETSAKLINLLEKKKVREKSLKDFDLNGENTLKPLNDRELLENLNRAKELGLFDVVSDHKGGSSDGSVLGEEYSKYPTNENAENSNSVIIPPEDYEKTIAHPDYEHSNRDISPISNYELSSEKSEKTGKSEKGWKRKNKKGRNWRNKKSKAGMKKSFKDADTGKNVAKRYSKATDDANSLMRKIEIENEKSRKSDSDIEFEASNLSPLNWLKLDATSTEKSERSDSQPIDLSLYKGEDSSKGEKEYNKDYSEYPHSIPAGEFDKSIYSKESQLLNQEVVADPEKTVDNVDDTYEINGTGAEDNIYEKSKTDAIEDSVNEKSKSDVEIYIPEKSKTAIENDQVSNKLTYHKKDDEAESESSISPVMKLLNMYQDEKGENNSSPLEENTYSGDTLHDSLNQQGYDNKVAEETKPNLEAEEAKEEIAKDEEKEEKKTEKASFKNKLSSLLSLTKNFFGFGKSEPKKENGNVIEKSLNTEYDNLTKMIVHYIQSYAALRHKFMHEGALENSFEEIKGIVKESIHFHKGTTEFDNLDFEKAIKRIAGMLGGGSFTAIKMLGLTGKDISKNLKEYLINLFPVREIEEDYKKDNDLDTTNKWLMKYFGENLIIEEMLPKQLERPSITDSSQELVNNSEDLKEITERSDLLCKKVINSLGKYLQESVVSTISEYDLDCLAVVAVNVLHHFTLSNSLYLFLFKYRTNLWKHLTREIALALSREIREIN